MEWEYVCKERVQHHSLSDYRPGEVKKKIILVVIHFLQASMPRKTEKFLCMF